MHHQILVYGLQPEVWKRLPYLEQVAHICIYHESRPEDIATMLPIWERIRNGEWF